MYSFSIRYEDNSLIERCHVVEASYNGAKSLITVSEEELGTHLMPVGKTIWLRTDNGTFVANGSGIRAISVIKE